MKKNFVSNHKYHEVAYQDNHPKKKEMYHPVTLLDTAHEPVTFLKGKNDHIRDQKEFTTGHIIPVTAVKTTKGIIDTIKEAAQYDFKRSYADKIHIYDMEKIFAELSEKEVVRNNKKDNPFEYQKSLYQISKDGRFHRIIFKNASILIYGGYKNSYGLRIYDEAAINLQFEEPELLYRTCRIYNRIVFDNIILFETKDSYYILSKTKIDEFGDEFEETEE